MIHNEEKFEKVLAELLDEISGYPNQFAKNDAGAASNLTKSSPQTEKATYSIQKTVDDLRLCLKYLLFDLDATRRENGYFKKLLDDKEL